MVDLRDLVLRGLTEWGYAARAFDEADYPYKPNTDPAEWTVAIAHEPDIIVLIVDRLYGSRLANGLSVTENEWRAAHTRGMTIIPCLRKAAVSDLVNRESQIDRTSWTPSYVTEEAVLDFIALVRASAFALEFDTAAELLSKLDDKLRSLTPHMLSRLSLASWDQVRRKRTVTVVDVSLSLGDVFDRGLYVSPPHEVVSGNLPEGNLEQRMISSLELGHNLMMTGGPGGGKSSSLCRAFGARVQSQDDHPLTIPLYVECRQLSVTELGSPLELITHLFNLHLRRELWPHFSADDPAFRLEIFFDGLDEVQGDSSDAKDVVLHSPLWDWACHVITCRRDFFGRVFSSEEAASRYDYIVDLQPWSLDHAKEYITRKFRDDPSRIAQLVALLRDSSALMRMAGNPIGLVMLCSIDDTDQVKDIGGLYESFLQRWAIREAERAGETADVSPPVALSIWRALAWASLTSDLASGSSISSLPLLFEKHDNRRTAANLMTIRSLLEIGVSGTDEILIGFVHPSIREYLIAAELAEKLKRSPREIAEALEQDTWYEVNEFAQRLIARWTELDCVGVSANLIQLYEERTDGRPQSLLVRNKACYYIGRLGRQAPGARQFAFGFLDRAWRDEVSPFVRQSIGFARSIGGEPGAAAEFIMEMRRSDDLDGSNRGYHLAYYGDLRRETPPPYMDPGNTPWPQTRRALAARLSDDGQTRRHSRAVDLYTFSRFTEVRGERLTAPESSIIAGIQDELATYPDDIQGIISNICDSLIRAHD